MRKDVKQRKKKRIQRKTPIGKPPVSSQSGEKRIHAAYQRVLVTEASGCVASFLIPELLKKGYQVVAVDFKGKSSLEEKERLCILKGDLSDPAFAARLVEGVDAVINTAAIVDLGLPYSSLAPINVDAVRVLFENSKQAGVSHFIQVSSGSLYRECTTPVHEAMPTKEANDYEKSRIDAEKILLSKPRVVMPYVTILRPSLIYGPHGRVPTASIATLPPLVKSLGPYYIRMTGGPKTNMVHAADVARAAVFLLNNPRAYGEVFNIADNDPRHFTDFINIAMEVYGLKPLGPGIPYPPTTLIRSILPYIAKDEVFNPLNKMSGVLWNRLTKKYRLEKVLLPRIDKETLEFGVRTAVFDTRKIKALGFQLKYPRFPKGWKNTVAWYQENRWIPRSDRM